MRRVPFIRLSYFLWAPVVLVLVGMHATFGLPHALFSYSFHLIGGGDQWNLAERWYTRCTYAGPYGTVTTLPSDGQCPWFVLHRPAPVRGDQ